MKIVETFGKYVDEFSNTNPKRAQILLKTGWEAQNFRFHVAPEKQLMPADRYLARLMMDTMTMPLKNPEKTAMVSVFAPCELIQEAGLNPYNVESFSCYLSASLAEREFIQEAEDDGISETLCSYHKTFIGAAKKGVLPKPKCIVYTNLVCDANLVTFKKLAELYDVPVFSIDVPMQQNDDNVAYVEEQLRRLAEFLEKNTGHVIDEEKLKERLSRSKRSLDNYRRFQREASDKYVPADLVTPLYCGMVSNILLGTEKQERYTEMLLRDVKNASENKGKRIYWMHTIPFWSDAVKKELSLNEKAHIVGCELADMYDIDFDVNKPYEALAKKMVYHALNGNVNRRIENGIKRAKEMKADGVVWFCHWGCKHTLGSARLAKKKFEEQGIPLLLLDGDGCDRSHGGEGQTSTRLGAFLEMLGGAANE